MEDKETNKRNEQGAHGLWISRWNNGNKANTVNYINGRKLGHSAHYGDKEELITSFYYAR